MKTCIKTNTAFTVCILALLNTSCVHYYYAPSSNNVPLFKEKNEARIQAQYSTVGANVGLGNVESIGGFELQTAYAAGKHVGLLLNYLHAGQDDPEFGSGNGNYIEVAAGYFKPSKNKYWIFETYAGIGTGTVKSVYKTEYIQESAKTSVTKFFIQPSFGYSTDQFAVAFSSKISFVNFSVSSSSLTQDHNPTDFSYVESLSNGKSYIWWEPGLVIRGGFKHLQAFMQVTYSMQSDETLPFCRSNFALGVVVPFKIKSTAKP